MVREVTQVPPLHDVPPPPQAIPFVLGTVAQVVWVKVALHAVW